MNLARIPQGRRPDAPASKPILEINLHHPGAAAPEERDQQFDDWGRGAVDQALLAEGGSTPRRPGDLRQAYQSVDARDERRHEG